MAILIAILTYVNLATNAIGKFLFAPIAVLPGWLSNTIISAVAGVFLMLIFKYTSNQDAIGKTRDLIKANMLALKLFKDSISVTISSQGKVFKGAFGLLFHAIRPMAVMIFPVVLLMGQMGLWYQYRPLTPNLDEAMVTLQLNGDYDLTNFPQVSIEDSSAFDVTTGPIRAISKGQVFWKIKANQPGTHNITFNINQKKVQKQLVAGEGLIRISAKRPGQNFEDILLNPWEEPFPADSVVQSIAIDYPDRPSKTAGTNWWMLYFFIASMVAALIFKPIFKVKINKKLDQHLIWCLTNTINLLRDCF